MLKVQMNRAIIYPLSNHQRTQKKENLMKRHKPNVGFSNKVRAEIMELVESWAATVIVANGRGRNEVLRFLTLTLPTKQTHCDKTIMQKCLLPMLKSLGEYLFVCERQKNGNIHFHCIIDSKISAKNMRLKWNKQLNELGYIYEYKRDREEFFKNGFVYVENGISLVQQQIWYSYGTSTKWENPHTVDIREITNPLTIGAYITKYMTKSNNALLCCNRWGKSKQVGKLSSPKLEDWHYTNEEVDFLVSMASGLNHINEFVTIIYCRQLFDNLQAGSLIEKRVLWHFNQQANIMYP